MTDQMIDIYMDGFASGAATLAMNILGGNVEQADLVAGQMANALLGDEAAMRAVRDEIAERLAGVDTGPKTVPVNRNES